MTSNLQQVTAGLRQSLDDLIPVISQLEDLARQLRQAAAQAYAISAINPLAYRDAAIFEFAANQCVIASQHAQVARQKGHDWASVTALTRAGGKPISADQSASGAQASETAAGAIDETASGSKAHAKVQAGTAMRSADHDEADQRTSDSGHEACPKREVPIEEFARQEAQLLLSTAAREEAAVTSTLRDVAGGSGSRLVGLENVLKSEASLARKIADQATIRAVATGVSPQAAVRAEAAGIKDALRYTMEIPSREYMATYERTMQTLRGQGCEQMSTKNTWAHPGSLEAGPYRGINESWKTTNGQIFELQFHTPESFATKSLTHAMYEEMRAAGTSAARIAELKELMSKQSDLIPVPPGVVPNPAQSGGAP